MTVARRPNFIIIGAMKSATTTLHRQLEALPGIFMSEPKEPNFFSNDEIYAQGVAWYDALFADADEHDLCGESSTHYTKLPTYPHAVERMHAHVPDAKLIYIMRHPVDRLISQYIHEWTQRNISVSIDQAIDQHRELVDYSLYAMQLAPFFEAYGQDRVLPVFFDRLRAHPQDELQRVCSFVGYDKSVRWSDEDNRANVSSERLRNSPVRDAVLNFPGMTTLRRTLVPRGWRDRVKRLWTMNQRPQLSGRQLQRVEQVFDDDLGTLGALCGVELTCENFSKVTTEHEVTWHHAPSTVAAS